jgi:hypothetical protein
MGRSLAKLFVRGCSASEFSSEGCPIAGLTQIIGPIEAVNALKKKR